MPNNFKDISEAFSAYVSKSGNDTTGDGSANNPYASIQKAVDSTGGPVLIGAGLYQEVINNPNGQQIMVADGHVEMDGSVFVSGSFLQYTSGTGIKGGPMRGDWFVHDYPSCFGDNVDLVQCNGMTFLDSPQFAVGLLHTPKIENCTIINCDNAVFFSTDTSAKIQKCTMLNCDNWSTQQVDRMIDNIFDGCSGIAFATDQFISDHNLFRNIPAGGIRHFATGATSSIPNSPFATLAAYQADPLTGAINDNSLDVDPLYNNIGGNDYTLSSASPVINAGRDGQQIGRYFESISSDGNTGVLSTGAGAIHTNITVAGNGDMTLTNPLLNGEIESSVQDLGALLNPIGKIYFWGSQELDANVFDTDNADSNPNHITFELRYSSVSAIDVAAQAYQQYLWNQAVTEDGAGVGNGETTFNPATAVGVSAQWVQIKITIRQDGTGG